MPCITSQSFTCNSADVWMPEAEKKMMPELKIEQTYNVSAMWKE